jgi:hypothetical protein
VGPRPVRNGAENPALSGFRARIVPARSESVYRLSHSGPRCASIRVDIVLKIFKVEVMFQLK